MLSKPPGCGSRALDEKRRCYEGRPPNSTGPPLRLVEHRGVHPREGYRKFSLAWKKLPGVWSWASLFVGIFTIGMISDALGVDLRPVRAGELVLYIALSAVWIGAIQYVAVRTWQRANIGSALIAAVAAFAAVFVATAGLDAFISRDATMDDKLWAAGSSAVGTLIAVAAAVAWSDEADRQKDNARDAAARARMSGRDT